MKLQVLLVLPALMIGVNAYAAEEPAAKMAEAAKGSVQKTEVKCEEGGRGSQRGNAKGGGGREDGYGEGRECRQ